MPADDNGVIPADQLGILLGCHPALVDILVSSRSYIVYSVFDSEGGLNEDAMLTVSNMTGIMFSVSDEDTILRGPVLIVTKTESN